MLPTTLPTRRLGRTPFETTRLELGLAALGRPAYITPGRAADFPEGRSPREMANRTRALLDVALELGVRGFDAARSYGQAEGFLAGWLTERDVEPGHVRVSSKWGYTYVGEWRLDASTHEVKSHDAQTFRRQWEASRKVLWSHLDVYQVHSLDPDSPLFTDDALLDELLRLKVEHGLTLGATVTGPEQSRTIHRVLELHRAGDRLFDTVQATFNLLEPSVGPALAEAHRQQMGVIVKEALANGRLAPGSEDPRTEPARAQASALDVPLDALALAAVLAQPWADVVLSGAVTRAQLQSNLRAFDVSLSEDAEGLFERVAEPAPTYWGQRSERPWS